MELQVKDTVQKDKQPFENFEELPCDIIDQKAYDQEIDGETRCSLSIHVEVLIGKNLGEDFQEAVNKLGKAIVARTTKRGTRFYAGDIEYNPTTGIISFDAGTVIPDYIVDGFKHYSKNKLGTTFADFCFLNSEGTKFFTKDQCSTPFRDDATPGDLTWVLPAKFVDDMVEMMSIMNNLILAGTMEESILYGPFLN